MRLAITIVNAKKAAHPGGFWRILFLFTFLFPYFLMHLKRHHQMLDHDIVSFLAIPFFQCVIISQMFIHSSLDTAFCGKGILRG